MHRNAPLAPEGRLRLCERIEGGWPVAHAAASMGISRDRAYVALPRQAIGGPPLIRAVDRGLGRSQPVVATISANFSNGVVSPKRWRGAARLETFRWNLLRSAVDSWDRSVPFGMYSGAGVRRCSRWIHVAREREDRRSK